VLLLAILAAPTAAGAHARSVSYSSWSVTAEGLQVQVRVPLLELTRLGIPLPGLSGPRSARPPEEPDPVGRYLATHLTASAGGHSCAPVTTPRPHRSEPGWVVYRWSLRCPSGAPPTVASTILLEQAPSHLHFARLAVGGADGRPARIVERVLSEAEPAWTLPAADDTDVPGPAPTGGSSFASYLALGIEHILTGWDHLAFVLALVLLARGLREVAGLVTGFTVAHSITLALATLRWVEPQAGPVEALIGFSVALIALENAWLVAGRGPGIPWLATGALAGLGVLALVGVGSMPALALAGLAVFTGCHFALLRVARDPGRARVLLAFAFGLIHGFGFAGVLAEMDLPTERLAAALLGFNLGVEVGQLGVVAAVWPLLVVLRSRAGGRPLRLVTDVASAAICGLGLFWFLTRGFGPGGP
jgi:hypothetical protein